MSHPHSHYWILPPTPGGLLQWVPAESSPLPVALLYGYGVFTTFKTPITHHWLIAHLRRLQQDAMVMDIPLPDTLLSLPEALDTFLKSSVAPQVVRITLFPHIDQWRDLVHGPGLEANPILVSIRPHDVDGALTSPCHLATVSYVHPMASIKHTNTGIALFHKRLACQEHGVDDVLWISPQGHITEATSANFFAMRGNVFITADVEKDGCLPGITRHQVALAAQQLNIPVHYTAFPLDKLKALDGAFLTNAVQGIRPVASIQGHPLPWPQEATDRFNAMVQAVAQINDPIGHHPETPESSSPPPHPAAPPTW